MGRGRAHDLELVPDPGTAFAEAGPGGTSPASSVAVPLFPAMSTPESLVASELLALRRRVATLEHAALRLTVNTPTQSRMMIRDALAENVEEPHVPGVADLIERLEELLHSQPAIDCPDCGASGDVSHREHCPVVADAEG